MNQITIEMPPVRKCEVDICSYNGRGCHAKAITVGDEQNPGCDTFLEAPVHCRNTERIAGVGACKVTSCRFNQDLECSAAGVTVGYNGDKINCLTYTPRA